MGTIEGYRIFYIYLDLRYWIVHERIKQESVVVSSAGINRCLNQLYTSTKGSEPDRELLFTEFK